MSRPVCKECGSELTNRIGRNGFFQRVLMFKLGWFPWECSGCRTRFYAKVRGQRIRRQEYSAADRGKLHLQDTAKLVEMGPRESFKNTVAESRRYSFCWLLPLKRNAHGHRPDSRTHRQPTQ